MLKPKTFLLAIACLCTLINFHAAAFWYTDIQIGDLTYSVNTSTLVATVEGADEYISGDVVIPVSIEAEPDSVMRTYAVTTIGEYAFSDCFSLASVTIPNSVTAIENNAFSDCI